MDKAFFRHVPRAENWAFKAVLRHTAGLFTVNSQRQKNTRLLLSGYDVVRCLMHSCQISSLKNIIMQKLEKSWTRAAMWLQFCERSKRNGGKLICTDCFTLQWSEYTARNVADTTHISKLFSVAPPLFFSTQLCGKGLHWLRLIYLSNSLCDSSVSCQKFLRWIFDVVL